MTTPILLRPSDALAAAMTAAAEGRGISRQAWMLAVLEAACAEYLHAEPHPDDVPLFEDDEPDYAAWSCSSCGRAGVDIAGREVVCTCGHAVVVGAPR